MKNRLSDLNNHLFAQLERLADDDLTPEQIGHEAKRGEAMVAVAGQIIQNAALQIQAAKIAFAGGADPVPYLPAPAIDARPALPTPQPDREASLGQAMSANGRKVR